MRLLDGYLGNSAPLPKFEWKCIRLSCKYSCSTYSQASCDALAKIHLREHDDETKERIRKFEESKKPKNYNKLVLTPADVGFLKTRGVKIDEDIEVDNGSGSKSEK